MDIPLSHTYNACINYLYITSISRIYLVTLASSKHTAAGISCTIANKHYRGGHGAWALNKIKTNYSIQLRRVKPGAWLT